MTTYIDTENNDGKIHFASPIYESWIGKKVVKSSRVRDRKAPKPFKSGLKVNTVKGVVVHPYLPGVPAFTFEEDDSVVRCSICDVVQTKEQKISSDLKTFLENRNWTVVPSPALEK